MKSDNNERKKLKTLIIRYLAFSQKKYENTTQLHLIHKMVGDQGFLVPLYASRPRPVEVNTTHSIQNTEPTKKVNNSAATNSMLTEDCAVLNNLCYCPNCELNFLDASEYDKHIKNKCIRKHTCTYCAATFRRNDHLKRHITSLHSNTKHSVCPVCDEDCKNYDLLLKHIKLHPDQSVNCRDCRQEFKSLYDLVVHESTHLWPESHACSYCNKMFKRRDHMLRHIQTLHLQQHTTCPICSQKYKRKDHALRHIREKHKLAIPYGGFKELQEKMMAQQ